MDLDRCLREKRGCKDYLPKDVSYDILGELLEAGTCAPSAGNLQNWIFIVVTEQEKKDAIAVACLNQFWMKKAPVHVVVCNDLKKITDMYPTRGKLYATQACAIAAQNIMVKAADLGLYSCWVGAFNDGRVSEILDLPEGTIPEMIITVGYSTALSEPLLRDSCEKVTYFNTYGNKERDTSIFPLQKQVDKAQERLGSFVAEKQRKTGGFFQRLFKRQ